MGWIILGLVGVGLAALVAYTLMRIASDANRNARRVHRKLDPFADVTTTRSR